MTVRVQALSASVPGNHAVVAFPHAGGSPRSYLSWLRELPAGIDLYGVTYPGRDMLLGEAAPETLVELASACAAQVEPIVRSAGSMVMFGHSMGAYVAFEATRSLQRSGIPVTALVVSGAEAPHFGTDEVWHRASDDDLVGHIGEVDLRSREVLAVPELRRMFLPTIRDDYRLIENYRAAPDPQLGCPIHILYGESDPEVSAVHSAAWAGYTRADRHVRSFPGDHFYLSAHAAAVAAHVSDIFVGCSGSCM